MDSLRRSSFALLFFLLFSFCVSSSAAKFNIPRLRTRPRTIQNEPILMSASESKDYKTFLYTQPLDHFNYRPDSYKTFQQRYLINFKYWDGANTSAPIFVLFGGEESIDYDRDINGFLPENAPHFKALLVYIEHRYYGKSVPFGSKEEAMKNASTLGYCNSAQAIADYAAVLLHIKQKYSAEKCPVIVIGGSYGGSHGHNDTMFPLAPFDLSSFSKTCEGLFGVQPKPHWVTTYYGGQLYVAGSHCLDILPAKESDPLWLIMQRKAEVEIIEGWLAKYHADLLEFEDETRARSQELE
ncbi:hypothetical protein WN944_027717 [Citrus x changshan-huyou]|uniref:Serine carboxypeptidase S28 family protein n=1 Tax=Citrus x changshan-huyou TaxID=2935761 RepID=A0AAP0LJ10_9ROSI